jgi:hypothetical protein
MSDFDPDRYLAEKTGQDFDPDAYLSEKTAQAAPTQPSLGDALRRGATQGATLGFGDEIVGAVSAPLLKLIGKFSGNAAYQDAFGNKPLGDLYREGRDIERKADTSAEAAHPVAYTGGQLAGGALTAPFAASGLAGAVGYGAASGLGGSEADLTKGEIGRAALDTAIGAGVGAAAHGVASGIGKLGQKALGRAGQIEAQMTENAARKAIQETLSARSEAGQAAQAAYRTLEHIRDLGAKQPEVLQGLIDTGVLDPNVVAKLEGELLAKSGGKLGGDVARKEATAETLSAMAQSEPSRAADLAEEALKPSSALKPLGRALGRYAGRAGAGAVLGGAVGGLSGHGKEGAGLGALGLNLALAPTVLRNATSPAMKRLALSLTGRLLSGAASGIERVEPSLIEGGERIATPAAEAALSQVPALRSAFGLRGPDGFDPDQYLKQKQLAEVLRNQQ